LRTLSTIRISQRAADRTVSTEEKCEDPGCGAQPAAPQLIGDVGCIGSEMTRPPQSHSTKAC